MWYSVRDVSEVRDGSMVWPLTETEICDENCCMVSSHCRTCSVSRKRVKWAPNGRRRVQKDDKIRFVIDALGGIAPTIVPSTVQ